MKRLFDFTIARDFRLIAANASWAIVPFISAVVFACCPLAVQAENTVAENQAGANRVASVLRAEFREADIGVRYQDGSVWLTGEMSTQEEINRAVTLVKKINSVQDVQNGLTLASENIASVDEDLNFPTMKATNSRANFRSPAPSPSPSNSQILQVAERQRKIQLATPSRNSSPRGTRIQHDVVIGQQALPVAYINGGEVIPSDYSAQNAMPAGHHAMPGQYNQPNLPRHAWPSYAAYPNYGEVTYPKQHSRKAWPYVGPYYPYPKVPLEWRKVTMEYHDGWWWLDFDDGSCKGPFSPLFRQPANF